MANRLRVRTTDCRVGGPCSTKLSAVQKLPLGAGASAPPLEGRLGAGPAVVELTGFQCRWPIGAADSDGFHFCAEPADPGLSPRYCVTHRDPYRGGHSRWLPQFNLQSKGRDTPLWRHSRRGRKTRFTGILRFILTG